MARPRKSVAEMPTTRATKADAGGRWRAKVPVGRRVDGTVVRASVNAATRVEMDARIRELEQTRESGGHRWTEEDPLLSNWLTHWLDVICEGHLAPHTIATYRSAFTNHLIDDLGGLRLSELEPELLEAHYRTLQRTGRSPHGIAGLHRALRSSLTEAARRRRIRHNPCKIARPPKVPRVEKDAFTLEEVRAVLRVAETERNGVRWVLALAYGIRQSEALGLLWRDVDFDTGTLHVRRQAKRLKWQHGCPPHPAVDGPRCGRNAVSCPQRHSGGLVLTPDLKTRGSNRVLPLDPHTIDLLRRHRVSQAAERLRADYDWDDTHDLVFPTPYGGIISHSPDNHAWHALLDRAGVRQARLHDARHTAATHLGDQGNSVATLMRLLGWTQIATAQKYIHAVDESQVRAANAMGQALWG